MEIADNSLSHFGRTDKDNALFREQYGINLLKKGIWVYFLLLIFEGALRKWVFPALATPLLIIRDPVALWLLYTAYKYGKLPSNMYLVLMYFCGILGFFTTMLIGHGNFIVAMYGERILLLHFPIMFLIGKIFDRDDVIKMGKVFLWIAIPTVVIIALQFYSPQSSFVNRGIGGDDAGSGFSGANGYFRPSGTFSFTTGNTQFFCLTAVFLIYFWLNLKDVTRLLLIGGSLALIIAIPLSISRTLSFQIVLTLLFALVPVMRSRKYIGKAVAAVVCAVVLFFALSQVGFFKTAVETLTTRFIDANESEGGIKNTLVSRSFAGVDEPFLAPDFPFFGMGIGMGTNAGAKLLTGRSDTFLVSEGEWGRLIGEMGSVLGTLVLFIRIAFCLKLVIECYKKTRFNDLLPWLLFSTGFQLITQGQWAQPTTLGFAILCGGLTIASLKQPLEETEAFEEIEE